MDSGSNKTEFYRVRSSKFLNLSNMSMTIGNSVHTLYTDNTGILREIRDGEGHPYIPASIAQQLAQFPAVEGWVIVPVLASDPEPEEEVVPVEITSDGQLKQASGTLAARLIEAAGKLKSQNTLLALQEARNEQLVQELADMTSQRDNALRELSAASDELALLQEDRPVLVAGPEDQQPAAPMVGKGGRLVKARKNRPTDILADDASISTLDQLEAENAPTNVNLSDLDDIPRT